MIITIGEQTQEALDWFGLSYPFSEIQLKTAFRDALKKHHPDLNNGSKESEELTKKTIYLHERIANLAISNGDTSQTEIEDIPEDNDLFKLWETCPQCHGTKYQKESMLTNKRGVCPICKGTGNRLVKCKACDGTGKFKQRNTGRIVDCLKCKGTGVYTFKRKSPLDFKNSCFYCSGLGTFPMFEEKVIKCSKCNGLGKVEMNMFNPVIRKGAVL
jgi:DnaJ-class molecular chaperone